MKKYRITKILVKTREIVSLSRNSADEIHVSACPTCHSLVPASSLPCPEGSAGESDNEKIPAELPTAEPGDNRINK